MPACTSSPPPLRSPAGCKGRTMSNNNNNDDDDKVKKLLDDALATGALSQASRTALDVVDVGVQINAGLGVSIDDVAASEVVLLTMMPDDSGSIAYARNTDVV